MLSICPTTYQPGIIWTSVAFVLETGRSTGDHRRRSSNRCDTTDDARCIFFGRSRHHDLGFSASLVSLLIGIIITYRYYNRVIASLLYSAYHILTFFLERNCCVLSWYEYEDYYDSFVWRLDERILSGLDYY